MLFSLKATFLLREHGVDATSKNFSNLVHLSKGHSPSGFVACQQAFEQTQVGLFMFLFQKWRLPWMVKPATAVH